MRTHEKDSSRDVAALVKKARQRKYLKESKLTDKERREVRYKQRELLKSMKENANDLTKLTTDTFKEMTQQMDEIYENVRYPREANLDAANLDELHSAVAKQSRALGASDLTKVTHNMKYYFIGLVVIDFITVC